MAWPLVEEFFFAASLKATEHNDINNILTQFNILSCLDLNVLCRDVPLSPDHHSSTDDPETSVSWVFQELIAISVL